MIKLMPNSLRMLALTTLSFTQVAFADISLWRDIAQGELDPESSSWQQKQRVTNARHLWIDRDGLDKLIDEGVASPSGVFRLHLPQPHGGFRQFEFQISGTMSPGLARKFPNIRAFSGRSLGKEASLAQMEVVPTGVSVQVLEPGRRWMIDAANNLDDARVMSYYARDARRNQRSFQCGVTEHNDRHQTLAQRYSTTTDALLPRSNKQARSRGSELRTYRLAVATTGEYTANHGATVDGGMAAVVKVINRVNGIFNSEISVGFELVDNNDEIIFADPDTDPFEGNDDTEILIEESQAVIDEIIQTPNYDLGHTFSTSPGGLASTGPCDDTYKANGVSGGISGDAFAVDYVAHEIGHQFSMSHTFNSSYVDCVEQRVGSTAVEPGSGTTIMSYSGICSSDNVPQSHLQDNSADPMFHSISFEQAASYVEGFGATCGSVVDTGNSHPTVDAGTSYRVPANTPLVLEGTGSDPDGDAITYSWEQRDTGSAAALSAPDDGAIPLFRTKAPVDSKRRYLPQLETVLSGAFNDSEKLPRKARNMTFALTARDSLGGRNSDTTEISVTAKPLVGRSFSLAEPDLGGSLGRVGTVRWHVGGTNVAPILTDEVEFYLSTDGGQSFQAQPFATAPNNGYARVEFPSGIRTDSARLMLKGRNNIFFDVSGTNFALDSNAAATPEVPAPKNISSASEGDSAIKINFSPGAGSGVNYYDAICLGEPSISKLSGAASPNLDFDHTESIASSIVLSGEGAISPDGLNVSVDISHTYRGDVVLNLISPAGRTIVLKQFDGSDNSADVKETYNVAGSAGELAAGEWRLEVSDGYEGDNGVLNSWSISGEGVTAPRTVAASIAPDLAFDDSKPITSEIEVSAEGDVSPDEFEVEVDIAHTYRSDVAIQLQTPSGKRIDLRDPDSEDSGDDVRGIFPTTLRSATPFSELAGETLSGTWSLHIVDRYAGDEGLLKSWSITQKQYVFAGRATSSPVTVIGLPANQSYECSLSAVYSGVTPPRQSQSVAAGEILVGTQPFNSQAETSFLNLLQTLLGLDASSSAANESNARVGSEPSEPRVQGEVRSDSDQEDAPRAIPVLGAWSLMLLMILMGVLGIRVQKRQAH